MFCGRVEKANKQRHEPGPQRRMERRGHGEFCLLVRVRVRPAREMAFEPGRVGADGKST